MQLEKKQGLLQNSREGSGDSEATKARAMEISLSSGDIRDCLIFNNNIFLICFDIKNSDYHGKVPKSLIENKNF
jgi:hypothetical protein